MVFWLVTWKTHRKLKICLQNLKKRSRSLSIKLSMYYFLKRTIDIFLSIVLLVVFSPVILVTAIAIKLTSKGPILADTPKRVGKDDKLFYPYKFRSMILDAHNLYGKKSLSSFPTLFGVSAN